MAGAACGGAESGYAGHVNAVARFWDESRVLVATTLRTWRSLLPLLLLLQLLGWFSYQASMATVTAGFRSHLLMQTKAGTPK